MDTQDPNVVGNYETEAPDPAPDPTPKKEADPNASHPLVAMLLRFLRTHHFIERYTVLQDVLENTVEFRIVLTKTDRNAPRKDQYERRR